MFRACEVGSDFLKSNSNVFKFYSNIGTVLILGLDVGLSVEELDRDVFVSVHDGPDERSPPTRC